MSVSRGEERARARVHGVKGIHIGDASLMPGIPAANIHVPTIMVAEKLSALITS